MRVVACVLLWCMCVYFEGSATIPNHVDGSRNHWESTNHKFPYLINRNHKNRFWNLGIKQRFQKILNHIDENSELRTVLGNTIFWESLQNFRALDQTQGKLQFLKVEKLEACIRPPFHKSGHIFIHITK